MLGGKGCSRRPDAKWRVMGTWVKWKWIPWKWKQRLRSGKQEDEAVKFKMSWPGQSSRWGVWSWAGGWTRGHTEVQSLNHTLDSMILSLICTTERKKADFLNFRADRKVLVYNVSCYLSEVIHPCFICVVSSPTVTCKSAAVYLCCIYVMALAQAREKSQICRTISIWSTVGSIYCIIKESNMLLS